MSKSIKLTVALLVLACVGCSIPKGEVISVTQSLIGIRAGQNPATGTPELQIGFFRATFQVVPTSTNILHVPMVNSSLSLDQKSFSTSIDENFLTGGAQPTPDNPAVLGARMRQRAAMRAVP